MQALLSTLDVETLLWWGGEGYAGEGEECFIASVRSGESIYP